MRSPRGLLVAGLLLAVSALPAASASPAPMPSAAPVPSTLVVEGSLETPDDQRTYAVLVPAAGWLEALVYGLDPIIDPVLEAYAPDGTWLGSDDDGLPPFGARVTVAAPEAGCYVLLVRSAGAASAGRFRLVVERPSPGAPDGSEACVGSGDEAAPAP